MIRYALPVLSLVVVSNAILQGTVDVKRLQGILEEGVKSKDVGALYFSLKGLTLLKAPLPDVCDDISKIKYDLGNIEQIFYLTNAAELSGCQNYLSPEVLRTPVATLDKKDASLADVYHAIYSMKALGKGTVYDREDSLKNLIQILKKDDTPANYAYVFALCEHMGCNAWTAMHAESALLAADETDSKMLHFDGGLPVTSLVLSTIFRVSLKFSVRDKFNKPVLLQQAFVRVAPLAGPEEAIYVAEPDNSKTYKVDLNVGAISKHLSHASGLYSVTLLLGDSAVAAPVSWQLADLALNFGRDAIALG
ncbi:jg10964 [Pararge aegeria aegeria]|uniref:Dolichyl-diphosphooligosaccharide--protein glycosyltransferase subunit 2 n=1 Tax=Pararge aegeria aegeria TaxID=348720 RepID=A0A8S4SCW3_9NEOP|nr:jg10964 [Pararge aegeria aegeria]